MSGHSGYNTDKNNFAPSIGVAWTPKVKGGILGKILGEDKTVIRAGYSIAYNRESLSLLDSIAGRQSGPQFSQNLKCWRKLHTWKRDFRGGLPVVATPPPPVYPLDVQTDGGRYAFGLSIRTSRFHTRSHGISVFSENSIRTRSSKLATLANHAIGIWRR